jgi:heptosyltransferase-2
VLKPVKSKLLVLELWGLGDLVLAMPFLQAATQTYQVTLVAKPQWRVVATEFLPLAKIVEFVAPWTAFRNKYRLLSWPWRELLELCRLRSESFDFGVSSRRDPRDHFLLRILCRGKRVGFPRLGSHILLNGALKMSSAAHRYDYWRALGGALNLDLPERGNLRMTSRTTGSELLVHTGGSQKTKIWPLDRYRNLVTRLRNAGYQVRVVCDSNQGDWWHDAGEPSLAVPATVAELLPILRSAGAFVGNDSGPGHLAALCGVPTFTLFGSALSECFLPLHPDAEWLDGSPCPYKPCRDYCRFAEPNCLWGLDEELVWSRAQRFTAKHLRRQNVIA